MTEESEAPEVEGDVEVPGTPRDESESAPNTYTIRPNFKQK